MARLIDTSVIVDLERRGYAVGELTASTPGERFALAAITVTELLMGVYRAVESRRRRQRQAFVEEVIAGMPTLPFDLQAARIHARVAVELQTHGGMIGANDLQIAATALANGYGVLTLNRREFDRVDGLIVQSPNW